MMYDLLNMLLDSVSLEKEMATHSSILAWRIPWTEQPGRLQSMGLQELDMTERLFTFTLLYWSLFARILLRIFTSMFISDIGL